MLNQSNRTAIMGGAVVEKYIALKNNVMRKEMILPIQNYLFLFFFNLLFNFYLYIVFLIGSSGNLIACGEARLHQQCTFCAINRLC